jgi:hypothetical protein
MKRELERIIEKYYLCFGEGSELSPTPNALTGDNSSLELNPTCVILIEAKKTKKFFFIDEIRKEHT